VIETRTTPPLCILQQNRNAHVLFI